MITSELIANVILTATGKVSTSVSGDAKWLKILGIANLKIDDWSNEPEVDWASLYNPAVSLGTVTATNTFAIPNILTSPAPAVIIRLISSTYGDPVRIIHTDGIAYTDYDIIPFDQLKQYPDGEYCTQIGTNLVFNHTFVSTDPQFGGTIQVPALLFPDHLVGDTDVVPVDNPNWLVYITAAEYIRTDVTRQNQYPNLLGEANQIMGRMKDDNDAQIEYVTSEWCPTAQSWL